MKLRNSYTTTAAILWGKTKKPGIDMAPYLVFKNVVLPLGSLNATPLKAARRSIYN
jgi:hypothetical protein